MPVLKLLIIILSLGTMCLHGRVYAQNNDSELKTVKSQLLKNKAQKTKLEQKINKISKELTEIKDRLTKAALAIRENEDKLAYIEERIADLETKKTSIETTLQSERVSIIKLIMILERIRKTPPQAMIARPETPYKTAQSALLMENIIPSVKRHAENLKNNLETLQRVSNELKIEEIALIKETKSLKDKNMKLSSLIKKKEDMYSKLNVNLKAQELTIQAISLKAKNLKDLMKKIKEEEFREFERQKHANIFRKKPKLTYKDNGQAQLPISGIIRVGYHNNDDLGASSNGITIEGRSGGLVIAPMSGKIQFTGTFKRYGNIIIIEHKDGFHSLIAGLDKISTNIGDFVKSGEPIGVLPDSSLIPRPKLYYELRKNGTPVNPSIKFSGLG